MQQPYLTAAAAVRVLTRCRSGRVHAANAKAVWNALANDRYRSAAGLQIKKATKPAGPAAAAHLSTAVAQPTVRERHKQFSHHRFGPLQDVSAGVRVAATREAATLSVAGTGSVYSPSEQAPRASSPRYQVCYQTPSGQGERVPRSMEKIKDFR